MDSPLGGVLFAMAKESRVPEIAVALGGGCLLLVVVCGGGAGAFVLADRFAAGDDAGDSGFAPPVTDPFAATDPTPVLDPTAPLGVSPLGAGGSVPATPAGAAMRQRYRPGPFVEVQGLLPAGLSSQRQLSSAWRAGRTIDNPWIIPGAELRPGAAPGPTAGGPSIALGAAENTSRPLAIVPGSAAQLAIDADAGSGADGSVQGLVVTFEGYEGHFFLPASVDSELGAVRVAGVDDAIFNFGIDGAVMPGGAPAADDKEFRITMLVSAIDVAGRVSAPTRRELSVLPVGTGDVEVTLTMTEATDLDLYVVDPTGVVIYYGDDDNLSGGRLDLDANAACGGNMGVNNEHVFWPAGRAPAGTYTVRVANFSSCIEGRRVNYTVTVRNCGETAVLRGFFEGEGDGEICTSDPGTRRQWCQNVVSFDVTPCGA